VPLGLTIGNYDEVFKVGERIQEFADQCRKEFSNDICNGEKLFTSKGVIDTI